MLPNWMLIMVGYREVLCQSPNMVVTSGDPSPTPNPRTDQLMDDFVQTLTLTLKKCSLCTHPSMEGCYWMRQWGVPINRGSGYSQN